MHNFMQCYHGLEAAFASPVEMSLGATTNRFQGSFSTS